MQEVAVGPFGPVKGDAAGNEVVALSGHSLAVMPSQVPGKAQLEMLVAKLPALLLFIYVVYTVRKTGFQIVPSLPCQVSPSSATLRTNRRGSGTSKSVADSSTTLSTSCNCAGTTRSTAGSSTTLPTSCGSAGTTSSTAGSSTTLHSSCRGAGNNRSTAGWS
ncbi:hypothetical protein HaLaN_11420 [Haematococcus lacustris]|uniref:Uncharacterized protein n=1 Tax=Haematococcus lacustris TaxID=44745 RepID=A0A699YY76_HAELA|nr:hypothetical protein HaLaN_11420 [Haematococcus lacustris]